MATVSEQVARIITRFKKDPDSEVVSEDTVLAFMNEAQSIIEATVILPNMESSSTIDLVGDQQEYSVASDVFKIVLVRYETNDWVLKEQNILNIKNRTNSATGSPQEFYVWGGSIGLYPVPGGAESAAVKYWYIKTLGTLVTSSPGSGEVTTSEIPANFHWVIERGAEMLMAQMTEDFDRAKVAENKFLEGIALMKERFETGTDNLDTTLYSQSDMSGRRRYLYDPYQ